MFLVLRCLWKNPKALLMAGGFLGFQISVSLLTGILICMGGIF